MIVLLTDFGQSEYVGVMKGVIYGITPEAKVVDLCHTIRPQDVIEASWVLKNNYKYFPKGATFCCVVDPGVGTQRNALAVKTTDYYFVGPDNGLLWETLREQEITAKKEIPIPADASRTFHGRDVFAKAATEIDSGRFDSIGRKTERIEELQLHKKGREGIVTRIDTFGNVITNLEKLQADKYHVLITDKEILMPFYSDYASATPGRPFLIEGSCGTLEISLRSANANQQLGLKTGQRITVEPV
jgi:S-adenosylmethionine hydrolase